MATETITNNLPAKNMKRRFEDFIRYVRRNPSLGVGLGLF